METTVEFYGVKKIVYRFEEQEILEALMKHHRLSIPKEATRTIDIVERYYGEDRTEPGYVEITIRYQTKELPDDQN